MYYLITRECIQGSAKAKKLLKCDSINEDSGGDGNILFIVLGLLGVVLIVVLILVMRNRRLNK